MEAGNDITTSAMGAGPYKFVGWDRGLQIDLEAYEGYYRPGLPKTKNVSFIFYLDETARNNALLTGEVDIIDYVNAPASFSSRRLAASKFTANRVLSCFCNLTAVSTVRSAAAASVRPLPMPSTGGSD